MRLRRPFLLLFGLAALSASPAVGQEPVARVKSAPQDFRGRSIELEGEVVELRGISPRTERGVYRLVDESDPTGVLIRTRRLPESGGPFRVEARLSPELLQNGALLLDEIDRDLDRSPLLPVALLLAALGLVAGAIAFGIYFKARQTERHLRLGPPMWLIPTAREEGAAAPEGEPPPLHFNYRLHYVEQERSARIDQRKRRSLALGVGCALIGVAGVGWLFALRRADAEKPAFILVTPGGEPAAAAPDTVAKADSAPQQQPPADTALRVAITTPPAPSESLPPAVRDSLRRRRAAWRDSVRQAREAAATAAAATSGPAPARTPDTAAPKVAAAQPVVEQPPPPPPPAPRDTVVAEAKPRPDPEAIRRAAIRELEAGIQRFSAAVVGRQVGIASALYPTTGDVKRRERFLDFLRSGAPAATLLGSDPPTVTDASAEASFTIAFRWRGDFGVERRKDVRFAGTARRSGEAWVFEGARLLEAFP